MKKGLPVSLRIVAWLFILIGTAAAIEMIVEITNNHATFHFGVLGIFIGIGLLKLRADWRTCGLVFIWIGLIGVPLSLVLLVANPGPLEYTIVGQKAGYVSRTPVFIFGILLFLLLIWEYWVLTRSDIKRQFGITESEQSRGGQGKL